MYRYFEAQSKLLKGCQQEQGTIGKNFSPPRYVLNCLFYTVFL